MNENIKVLVVEDDPSLREVIQDLLLERGLRVTTAGSGEDAVELARTQVFDLIISDIRMDGISGLDAIEQAQEIQPGLGSIVVSGYASEEETLKAVELNVAGYLKKPFKLHRLLELINEYLRQRSSKQRRDLEISSLRNLFFWSIQQQGQQLEQNGSKTMSSALLARQLAALQNLDDKSAEELYYGTLIRGLSLTEQSFPIASLGRAFQNRGFLLDSAQGEGLSGFALSVFDRKTDDKWPTTSELESEVGPEELELYQEFLAGDRNLRGGESSHQENHSRSLVHALSLEQFGDFEKATEIYQQIVESGRVSRASIRALLGLARLSARAGKAKELEAHIKTLLELSLRLGPATLALSSFEAASILKNSGHNAAAKLLSRTKKQLQTADYPTLWAVATIALASIQMGEQDEGEVLKALGILEQPDILPDLLEHISTLFPDLLSLHPRYSQTGGLLVALLTHYAEEVRISNSLSTEAKSVLLDILHENQLPAPQQILNALRSDSVPEIRERTEQLNSSGERVTVSASPLAKLYTLGGFLFSRGDTQLSDKDWRTQKAKYLFARLALSAPRPVPVEKLYEEFWPGDAARAKNNFNTCLSFIRNCLKKLDLPIEHLQRHGTTVSFSSEFKIWHDWGEFQKASKAAKAHREAGRLRDAIVSYNKMSRLYVGPYLDDCYLDWAQKERHSSEAQMDDALDFLMTQCFDQKRFREALEHSQNALAQDPAKERALEILMRSYLALEEHQKALEYFESYQSYLKKEYGTEPPIELLKYYQMARYQVQDAQGIVDI